MRKKSVIFISILLFFIQFILAINILKNTKVGQIDIVEVNEVVQLASKQWDKLLEGKEFNLESNNINRDFTVISLSGEVLYKTKDEISDNIYDAIKNGDTIVDISSSEEVVGKLIINNSLLGEIEENSRRLLLLFSIVFILEALILVIYMCYLNKRFFKPFNKLKTFAGRVADGDLEFPLEMDEKNVFGAFTESFDLMREELKKARANEREANKSKKELVAKLSHDIKTPVASIQALSELMLLSSKDFKAQKQLEIINEKSKQIDILISDLFHATLEELQELSVVKTANSSKELIEIISNSDYQDKAILKDIPECMLIFDRRRLQQVFDNIFSNSYKYANSDIFISFKLINNYLSIIIEDLGAGVKEEEVPLLFEKFYRGNNTKEKSGAGLGLFISRYLINEMEGRISCENTERGFSVIVSLKLA